MKYRSHTLLNTVEMFAYIDAASALRYVRRQCGQDVDIVRDDSAYYAFTMSVRANLSDRVHEETFWIDYTPLNYGGWRYWLKCLRCKRRQTKLYITDNEVACRKCLGLIYTSSTGSKDSLPIRLCKYQKSLDMIKLHRRMTYAGRTTRFGKRFRRYWQDDAELLRLAEY